MVIEASNKLDVDWEKIKSLDQNWRTTKPENFDEPPQGDDLWETTINPDIKQLAGWTVEIEKEIRQLCADYKLCRLIPSKKELANKVEKLKRVIVECNETIDDVASWYNRQRGVWLVTGYAGSGKGAFINMAGYKNKYYFGKTAIMDYRPASAFGYYVYFNQATFVAMLQNMSDMAEGEMMAELKKAKDGAKENPTLEYLTKQWAMTEGQVMFRRSVVILDEFKRYFDKRRPHNPMGLMLSDLFAIWRHLDMLVMGATLMREDIDQRIFRYISAEVRMMWLGDMKSLAVIQPTKYTDSKGVLEISGEAMPCRVDMTKPRITIYPPKTKAELVERILSGKGKGYKDLYNTTNLFSFKPPKSLTRGR
jgi:hypothetical protein